MRISRLTILACLVVGCSIPGLAASLTITNAGFSVVSISCAGYAYQSFGGDCSSGPPQQDFNGTPGFGWILDVGGTGLTAPGSAFNPPDFAGRPFSQAVFLQGAGSFVYQSIGGFSTGAKYRLTFYAGSRYFDNSPFSDGNQTVQVTIDGSVIGTWSLTSFTPFTLESVLFSVPTGGTHTLSLNGITPGDHTAFVSGISITQPVPEPSTLLLVGPAIGLFVRRIPRV
jgi:hypothetical protein